MDAPISVMLTPGPDHLHVMESLMEGAGRGGDLTPDVHLAALAVENGGTIYSQDADFARFLGVRWINPCA
jgi:predicted nucleic acid-binding protein